MSEIKFGEDVQENEESVGGWTADDSGIQLVFLKSAYLTESAKGALAFNCETADKDGNERRYQIYFTNRNKETFYTDTKTKEKRMLPGYQMVNNICMATVGKSFQEVNRQAKKKVIDLYDFESRKEIPTEVTTFPTILKKALYLGVIKVVKNKYKNGKPTSEKAEQNEIHTVFRKEDKRTPKEAADKKEAKSFDKWVKYWTDRVKDEYEPVEDESEDTDVGENPFGETGSDDTDLFGSDETTAEDSSDDTASEAKAEEEETTSEPDVTEDDDEDPFK